MINRDSWGYLYWMVSGEMHGSIQDKLKRKHLPRMFSLIKNESQGIEDDQIPSQSQLQTMPTRDMSCYEQSFDYSISSCGPCEKSQVFGFWGEYGRKAETQRN
eukprot:TRINITY_DN9_c0_g1_i1.p4 TRINITY_DN9_c0_g1~~TRINITY_DN9_c0_g1_i1.p4  ORF type:complete len:103 (-),score=2.19 TRINITY_DN9_c0_g1_i1:765-1073(-)